MPTDIAIKVEDRQILSGLNRLIGAVENTTPVMHAISQTLLQSVKEGFENEASPATVHPHECGEQVRVTA